MVLLGFDIGSSSVKVSAIDAATGDYISSAQSPDVEMPIAAKQQGWAEQDPQMWWDNLKLALKKVISSGISVDDIAAIGISYQMHGLVIVDKNMQVLRPSIIWCDSRAVSYGETAFENIGKETCLSSLLNSPGNFTASKLKWVKENEPDIFEEIYKIMLPGDYIAMRLSGELSTTISGLSEGMMWDYQKNELAQFLFDEYGFSADIVPDIVPAFGKQAVVNIGAAAELGLKAGIPVSYRAGDQPNNALSLNVLKPGEIAATAGTSGVVYGVSAEIKYDPLSRVNTFAHVNYSPENPRLGVLLCVNGTGILNSWLKKTVAKSINYPQMNELASTIPVGSDGLLIYPFGNGAERMLENENPGCSIKNLNFNIHSDAHLYRAAQEGIVFSFQYGLEIMQQTGINAQVIRAGNANMFLSPVFRQALADVSGATIELYNTDGSKGAALGAGIGAGVYSSFEEAFQNLKKIGAIEPDVNLKEQYTNAFSAWKSNL